MYSKLVIVASAGVVATILFGAGCTRVKKSSPQQSQKSQKVQQGSTKKTDFVALEEISRALTKQEQTGKSVFVGNPTTLVVNISEEKVVLHTMPGTATKHLVSWMKEGHGWRVPQHGYSGYIINATADLLVYDTGAVKEWSTKRQFNLPQPDKDLVKSGYDSLYPSIVPSEAARKVVESMMGDPKSWRLAYQNETQQAIWRGFVNQKIGIVVQENGVVCTWSHWHIEGKPPIYALSEIDKQYIRHHCPQISQRILLAKFPLESVKPMPEIMDENTLYKNKGG